MRAFDSKTWLGLLALAAFVLLASPGVRAVRAAELDAGAAHAAGPQCGAGEAPQGAAELSALLQQVRRQVASERAAAAPAAGEVVVLNGRGYNYGLAPDADPSALLEELELQR